MMTRASYSKCFAGRHVDSGVQRHEDDFSEPFLGGQNHYKMFCEMVKGVDGSLTCAADQVIRPLYKETCTAYSHSEKTKEEAIAALKEQVANTLGIE